MVNETTTVRTLADLATVLRNLRRREARARQGRELTYGQIAAKTGWSVAIIGGYLTGTAMPPTDRFDVLIRVFGASAQEQGALATARDTVADTRRGSAPTEPGRSPARPVPRQLPAPPTPFIGRSEQVARLDAAVAGGTSRIPVAAVTGMAGVGKTALALHWAHRIADRFPDGQLYVDLRGYDPTEPVDPADALAGFLRSLGVSQAQEPLDLFERAAVYRTILAERQMLIVLDNARAAAQVRPLLPGSSTCMVVVTSRDTLAGLVATDGAHRIDLDVLTMREASALLWELIGDRVDAAAPVVESLARYCGRLPLAIRVAAEFAAHHGTAPLSDRIGDLRDEQTRLDALDTGEATTAVRSVLSWSYRTLSVGAARLFRLFSCGPGPDLGAAAVASLGGLALPEARRLLTELTRAHMLTETEPGRHSQHDLLRAYARELALAEDSETQRSVAVRRLLDHYVHSTVEAERLLDPNRHPVDLVVAAAGVIVEVVDSADAARRWFAAERVTLLAATALAGEQGYGEHAWQLAWAMANFLDRGGYWQEWAGASAVAIEAATHPAAGAHAHRGLARAAIRLRLFDTGLEHYQQAAVLLEELGDVVELAIVHLNLSELHGGAGRALDAIHHGKLALALFKTAGHQAGQAASLNNIGYEHSELGEYRLALDACSESLRLSQEIGDHACEAPTLDSLGHIYHRMADYAEAITCYREALRLHERSGHRLYQATVWTHLGDVRADANDAAAATGAWRYALAIYDELDRPEAADVRSRLRRYEAVQAPFHK